MKPFLSIITPVLNNERFISQAIENYLSVAKSKTELIIVDGGSTDRTIEIIKSYASNRQDIKWISERDSGQSDAMNKGIRLASGDYISFLNVDDYYSKGTFIRVIQILQQKPFINFLVGDCNVWNAENKLIFVNRPSKLEKWHVLSGYYFPVNPTAYFYKKQLHSEVGFYKEDNHYNMDLEFIIQARLYTPFYYMSEIWGNFRMLPNTKTFSDMEENLLEKRKQDLLRIYFNQVSFYIRFRIKLYRFKRIFFPIIVHFLKRLRDKIKFEIKKIKG